MFRLKYLYCKVTPLFPNFSFLTEDKNVQDF